MERGAKCFFSTWIWFILFSVPFGSSERSRNRRRRNRSRFPASFALFAGIWTKHALIIRYVLAIMWKQVNRDERPTSGLSPRHNSARLSISFPTYSTCSLGYIPAPLPWILLPNVILRSFELRTCSDFWKSHLHYSHIRYNRVLLPYTGVHTCIKYH